MTVSEYVMLGRVSNSNWFLERERKIMMLLRLR